MFYKSVREVDNLNENEEILQRSYFSVIPANVRYDETLTANAKLLYGEITALANQKGYCFASNNYFAQLYKVTPQAISKWVNMLANKGYIHIQAQKNGLLTERRLYVDKIPTKKISLLDRDPKNELEEIEKAYLQNYKELYEQGVVKMDKPVINWAASRKITKDCISKYGFDTILNAVKASKYNTFVVAKGYVLTTILSAGILSQLINSTNRKFNNDNFVVDDIDF